MHENTIMSCVYFPGGSVNWPALAQSLFPPYLATQLCRTQLQALLLLLHSVLDLAILLSPHTP